MNEIKYYITAGFMGSGSSALTDLLCEFEDVSAPNGNFEYVFLHAPNGVFDLEDKLLKGNNALRSDEAIHSFMKYMDDLYRKKHYWVANYRERVSKEFNNYTEEFINDLHPIRLNGKSSVWYYKQNPDKKMLFLRFIRKLIYLSTFKQILIPAPLKYQGMILAYPSSQEFYAAASKYIYKIMNELKGDKEAVVLDQFLLPHNMYRIDNYFNSDVMVFEVDRDPRDVFILNKYYWSQQNVPIPFSLNVKEFCEEYRRMRESVRTYDGEKVVKIQFEDLIYNYEKTLHYIYEKTNLDASKHTNKGKYFNPSVSIANTNLQRKNKAYLEETTYIEKKLEKYIYHFPQKDIRVRDDLKVF